MKLKWVDDNRAYSNSKMLYLGQWIVGSVQWVKVSGGDNPNKYKAISKMPGIKSDNGIFETEVEAQAKVEELLKYWFSKLDE